MFDTISVIIGVVGALLGIAGTILAVGGVLLLVALIKKLPSGVRAIVSATAASIVLMTFLKHFALEYFDFLLFKSMIGVSLAFGVCGLYLILGSVVLGNWVKMLFASAAAPHVSNLSEESPVKTVDNRDNLSAPSSFLKAFSVMLQ